MSELGGKPGVKTQQEKTNICGPTSLRDATFIRDALDLEK